VIDRRTFLAGTGVALLAAPLVGEAQEAKVPKIGVLSLDFPNDSLCVDALRRSLNVKTAKALGADNPAVAAGAGGSAHPVTSQGAAEAPPPSPQRNWQATRYLLLTVALLISPFGLPAAAGAQRWLLLEPPLDGTSDLGMVMDEAPLARWNRVGTYNTEGM
jgi:hypothetical protein